jgi:hypothetical protein
MCFCFFFSFAIWRGFVKFAACFQSFYKFCLLKVFINFVCQNQNDETKTDHMSFVRKVKDKSSQAPLPGTRASLNQVSLTSTGIDDLDGLLGGGIPVGSMTLVVADKNTQYHHVFTRYVISEGVAQGQFVVCITSLAEKAFAAYITGLPRNLTVAESQPDESIPAGIFTCT